MKVLTYNVRGWRRSSEAPNLDLIEAVIRASNADVVGLNEVFHPDGTASPALTSLAGRLGMAHAFGATISSAPQGSHPPYGNAVLSRWPILAYAAHHLTPETDYGQRGLLEVRVLAPSGATLTLYATHLDHRSESLRVEQWEAARTWLLRDRGRPHVLLGDLNALNAADYAAPGALDALQAYNKTRGWAGPAFDLIERIARAGYVDALGAAGVLPLPTYPAHEPERRIDYIFLPESLAPALTACSRLDTPESREASDHLPVLAELSWE